MKLPINSIKEYTDCNLDLEKILHILSTKVGEVEGYTDFYKMYEGIYIGEIVSKEQHPDADKLGIYNITIGEPENIQVVAGDKSLSVGDKIAYIKPGNIVPSTYNTSEEFKIKAVKMRGVLSNGMLCSEKELNIGTDHTKVLILDSDALVGSTFAQYFGLNDTVVDIENKALTNRGDLFGILGLSREIAGAQNIPFITPGWYKKESIDIEVGSTLPLTVSNEASNLCPRYMCVSLENISVKQSPVWLKSILIKSGIRPINNIVDITNYLSILTGQPLHAFDYDKVVSNDPSSNSNAHITVRLARVGERIHTLDGNLVELTDNNLVIADSTNPIAIAGVIGGIDTEIDKDTKNIIIESASFDKFSIRRTSMELGIFTEAVTRYTRGQDPNLCLPILLKAIELVKEIGEGKVSSSVIDSYPNPSEPRNISLSISKLNTHLGTVLSKDDIKNILLNIEYKILEESEDGEYITVCAPVFRTDIYIPEDIYEDIGRIYGYENIVARLPLRDIRASRKNSNVYLKTLIRNILSNSGCNELDTYSFTSMDTIQKSKQDPNIAYHIKNSLSPQLQFMRVSLISSLLEKGKYNIQKNINTFCIYEFNIPHQKGYVDSFELPKEDWHLSLLFSSKENILEGNPYYQVKKYFEKISNSLNISSLRYELISESSQVDIPIWIKNILPTFNRNGAVIIKSIKSGKESILGVMGDIDGEVKSNFKLPEYTSGIEINLEELKKVIDNGSKYVEESKYPAISQDLCLTVPSSIKYEQLESVIIQLIDTKDRKGNVECIDIYQKDKESKNITVRVSIEHKNKTLTDKEYSKIKSKIEEKVNELN
ncbi:MAG: phenylalanine--tRNA ligase subunit beta [Candidatus Dojkabacteria bacterium]|jgi:phenylalanyl-tRNA synthetase beta chain|nr:phenylalanine--tRNA ligase subunit beta [Candidatus Dojkabacteria bacterium]